MAFVRVTADLARKKARVDPAKLESTTEEEIRRHVAEDGLDPDNPVEGMRPAVSPALLRARVGMTQKEFAEALGVSLRTLQSWEQGRTLMEPAIQSLLSLVDDSPEQAFRVLGARLRSGSPRL